MLQGYIKFTKTIKNVNFNDFMDNDILCEKFGVYIQYIDLSEKQSLRIDNQILLNKILSTYQQREIILHELGHTLFHATYFDLKKMEYQANKYSLLMAIPDKFIFDDLANDDYLDMYDLSNRYQVTHNFMLKRLEQIYHNELEYKKHYKLVRNLI